MEESTAAPHISNGEAYDSSSTRDRLVVTWRNLCVAVGKAGEKAILQNATGFAESGHLLAIMGPSGCGKTTLLDALAGRLALNATQRGQILINGRKQALAFGTSGYVTQDDCLMATLTVKEAMDYSAQLQLPDSMSISEKKERANETIKDMGLHGCMNTVIGGEGSKGLSGGQKKRLSICLEILTRPRLLFMDEPTSGLDSAAAYHVMKHVSYLARNRQRTVITSIHQPSGEIFKFFDNVCLLASGKTVYFGMASYIDDFFVRNGYPCPPMMNPADHYLRVTNKNFEQERGESTIEHDLPMIDVDEATTKLVESYKYTIGKDVDRFIVDVSQERGPGLKKGTHASFLRQCWVLTRRSTVNMYRDKGYYWIRLGIYLIIALALASIFWNLRREYSDINDRVSVLIFLFGFLTFMTIGGFPSFVEDIKIFERERLNGHYGVAAYVISHTLSSAPFLVLVSLIPGTITFFSVDFHLTAVGFVYFFLDLLTCMAIVESIMMMVAAVVPDMLLGVMLGAGIQGIFILVSGFFRRPNRIPNPVWKYPLHYMCFHKYAAQGAFKNEFYGQTFRNKPGSIPKVLTGEQVVEDTYKMEVGYSKWVDLAVLFGMVVIYRLLFFLINKLKEKVKPKMRGVTVLSTVRVACTWASPPRHTQQV